AIAVTNCTAALHLALRILEISADDEVILPSLTFVATAAAVRYVGAIPVFCDIKGPQEPTLDPAGIRPAISTRTKAILVMHYAGFPCDMGPILDLAKSHGLFVIEDAAHAPLSEYEGRKVGALGDVGCFSFFANKNVCTAEGGMLVTNNDELA